MHTTSTRIPRLEKKPRVQRALCPAQRCASGQHLKRPRKGAQAPAISRPADPKRAGGLQRSALCTADASRPSALATSSQYQFNLPLRRRLCLVHCDAAYGALPLLICTRQVAPNVVALRGSILRSVLSPEARPDSNHSEPPPPIAPVHHHPVIWDMLPNAQTSPTSKQFHHNLHCLVYISFRVVRHESITPPPRSYLLGS
jgi:hypothetical protein